MRLRLARICGTGDVLAEHAAFRCQRPEFFDVVNRGCPHPRHQEETQRRHLQTAPQRQQ